MAIKKKEPDYGGWIRPFTDRESAIAALNEFIPADNRIGRGGMYLLEIINQLIQNGKEIFERIPSEIFSGCPEGGRKNVAAAALCRAGNGPVPTAPDETLESGYTRAQEIVGQWAERDGCWSDSPETDQIKCGRLHNDLVDGSEAHVYIDDPARMVYKTIDFSHYPSFATFLDRISIHNALFPEMAMHVEGFGMREGAEDNKGYVAVVRQPFAIGRKPASEEEMDLVRQKLEERGIKMPEVAAGWFFVSESGHILIADVHDDNCVFDSEGNLHVYDCEAYLNINPALGGTYVIPPLTFSEESVKEIKETVKNLLPLRKDMNELMRLLDCLPEKERERVVSELLSSGTTLAPVKTTLSDNTIIQVDPERKESFLLSTAEKIKRMLEYHDKKTDSGDTLDSHQLSELAKGKAVTLSSGTYVFNLDKGRLDNEIGGMRIRLNQKHEVHLDREKPKKKNSVLKL